MRGLVSAENALAMIEQRDTPIYDGCHNCLIAAGARASRTKSRFHGGS